MQERYGGNGRPTLAPFAVNDYGTGFMGAYGVALALLHRRNTGKGQHVDTSPRTPRLAAIIYLQDYAGKRWTSLGLDLRVRAAQWGPRRATGGSSAARPEDLEESSRAGIEV
jgi:crotonobetainyl-CoA:carnitine CoA-transferase CaiB-like acyl-CoA transferase